jgi:hypothetical protein
LGTASKANSSSSSTDSSTDSSRLLVGLHEAVQQLTPRSSGEGLEVITSSRR